MASPDPDDRTLPESDPDATVPAPPAMAIVFSPDGMARMGAAVREAAPPPPTVIGPYHIIAPIGEGGMGTVYKAEQRHPIRRIVALKVIKLGMDTKNVIARFRSEQQALTMMDHPHIAKVLDAGITDRGQPYFVMEYVAGEPITAYCDRQKLDVRQRLALFGDVCSAVQHSHTKGIIHRDLKPTNILVAVKDGQALVKEIDFGVAKATQARLVEQTMYTEQGALLGTPEYMSPEQAENNQLDIDTRSDIYSLGVLLYELLTSCLPFESKSLRAAAYGEIQRVIREEEPPRPSTRFSSLGEAAPEVAEKRRTQVVSLTKQLAGELGWIPLKALRKDRTERYQTATALQEDVGNYLDGRPLVAGPISNWYRIRKFMGRNRARVTVATATILLFICGVAFHIHQITSEKQRTTQALTRAEIGELEANKNAEIAQTERDDILRHDIELRRETVARYINLGWMYDLEGNSPLALLCFNIAGQIAPEGSREQTISRIRIATYMRFGHKWSPIFASSRVGCLSILGSPYDILQIPESYGMAMLRMFTFAAATSRLQIYDVGGAVWTTEFDLNGTRIVAASSDTTARVWKPFDLNGSLVLKHPGEVRIAKFSPNGSRILTVCEDTIRIWDSSTGLLVGRQMSHGAKIHFASFANNGVVISGGEDGTTRFWSTESGNALEPTLTEKGYVICAEIGADERHIFTSSTGSVVSDWDKSTGQLLSSVHTDNDHKEGVLYAAFSVDRQRMVACMREEHGDNARVYNLVTHQWASGAMHHNNTIRRSIFSPDGSQILTASDDTTACVWNAATGQPTCSRLKHGDKIFCAAFNPSGTIAITGSADRTARLWDAATGFRVSPPLR